MVVVHSAVLAIIVSVLGLCTLIGYYVNRAHIRELAVKMSTLTVYGEPRTSYNAGISFYHVWLWCAGIFGLVPTITALFLYILHPPESVVPVVGNTIFLFGAAWWAFKPHLTAPLGVTCVGVIIWAGGTTYYAGFVVVCALYHIIIDGCIYTAYMSSFVTLRKYGAWNLWLACVHVAAASFVMSGSLDAEYPYNVDILQRYDVWIETTGATGNVSRSVIPALYNVHTLNVGVFLSMCSWISGLHHLITYIGIFEDFRYITKQASGESGNVIRTVDWMFSASIMFTVGNILFSSELTLGELLYGYCSFMFIMACGYAINAFSYTASGPNGSARGTWMIFGFSSVLYVMLWIPTMVCIWLSRVEVDMDTHQRQLMPPNVVYVFWGVMFTMFSAFPMVTMVSLCKSGITPIKYEIAYSLLSMAAKVTLLSIYYGGLLANPKTSNGEVFPGDQANPNLDLYEYIGIGTSIAATTTLAMGIHMYYY